MKYQNFRAASPFFSRRNFLKNLVIGGGLLALSSKFNAANAAMVLPATPELGANEFELTIDYGTANLTGRPHIATTVNGSIPGPTLRWKEGETVKIHVTNRLREDTSIHWHGIILPNEMDGVPGLTFGGIKPGETFTYQFKVQQSGTYWYHSHSGFQEQTGVYGAIIIDPAHPETHGVDRDYVMVLSDWTDEDPMRLLQKLRMQSDYYNESRPTLQDFLSEVYKEGISAALNKRQMWNEMRMNPTDIADISGKTYTYLINGASPSANWTGVFKAGEKIRLRFVNAATQSFFDVRIPGLKLTVIGTDGQAVIPVEVDEFRCAPGETYDVLVTPAENAYTLFAQAMDRSGYACATLATQAGMVAAIPLLDKAEWLSMDDMMGDMMSTTRIHHAKAEYSANVDARVDTPRTNLDDPGVNLRDNGRRVLTYADLHSIYPPLDTRKPTRDIELHLTGNMGRYLWSIDGVPFSHAMPIHFMAGERLRLIVVNDTMMLHPFHLHGMWSDLENAEGEFQVRKHTIVVQPAQRVSYLVSADALGRWALHCHLLYHMEAGMFREVVVA